MSPLKYFFLAYITDLRKHRFLLNVKNLKHFKKLVFHKHASSFLKRIFSKVWRCLKSRCLAGVFFFARFSTSEENRLPHNLWFFMRISPSVSVFKMMSVNFRKKTWKRKNVHPDFQNPVSTNPLTNFVLSAESFLLEVRKCELKKLIKKFSLLKAIFCTLRKQFWQPFQNLWL